MQGKVHVAVGVTTVAYLVYKHPMGFDFNGTTILPVVALLTAAAGSYAPDIDMGTTHAGRKHQLTSKVVNKVGGGHRGITHTLLFPAIIFGLIYFTQNYLSSYAFLASLIVSLLYGFEIGWVLHIFADLFNGKGCPVLWPLMKGKVHIMDLPSKGFGAWCFYFVYLVFIIIYALEVT